jgi:hypothetical protein
MLDVAIGPKPLGGGIVALIEQRLKGFEDEGFVLFGRGLGHLSSFGFV